MKKVICAVFFLAVSFTAMSQVQIFGKYSEGSVTPDINVFGYGPKLDSSGKFRMIYFALFEQNWAEGIVGVNYSPRSWVEFGLGIGMEQNPALYRLTANIWLGKDMFSFFTWVEKGDGKDNYWYKSVLGYAITPKFTAELIAWRFNGVGLSPKLKLNNFSIWAFPAYDFESKNKNMTFGVDIKI